MNVATKTSLATALLGGLLPAMWTAVRLTEQMDLILAGGILILAVSPFLLAAALAWAVRRDTRASRFMAIVSGMLLMVALAGWGWALIVHEALVLVFVGSLLVPGFQLFILVCGAIISGIRPRTGTARIP
jgi:phosphotransferase system  glucose/maltose/N-acetylglucosamine-specific IIC component